jgi:hypothetical protein
MGDEAFAKVERAVNQMFDPYIAMAERDAKGTDVRLMGESQPAPAASPPPAGAASGAPREPTDVRAKSAILQETRDTGARGTALAFTLCHAPSPQPPP